MSPRVRASRPVIVVGAGLAGLCAAVAAAEDGASVVVLEKTGRPGGSTVLSGGFFAFAGTTQQAALGIADDSKLLAHDLVTVGEQKNDRQLVGAYAEGQTELAAWLSARGLVIEDVELSAGQSVPRSHRSNAPDLITRLRRRAEELGVEFRWNTPATNLTVDRGRVTGVATEQDSLRGRVVLATGGFSRSESLMARYAPDQARALRLGGPGNTGDGLHMAEGVGAGLRDLEYVKGTFGTHPRTGDEAHELLLLYYLGAIIVNRAGLRYVDESLSYKLLGDACLAQPDPVSFQVFDRAVFESAPEGVPLFDPRPFLERGLLFEADDLADLAAEIDVPAATLEQTIEEYNTGVAEGTDALGRTGLVHGSGSRPALSRAPWYAFPSTSVVLATYCGITIDATGRALDEEGQPIEGLWAAGELTGGFHGAAYMTGSSLGKAAFFGRRAGQAAAHGCLRPSAESVIRS